MSRPGSVDLLALRRERVELRELVVVEAQLLDELRRDGLLEGSAIGRGADRDLLQPGSAFEHRAVGIEAERVGDHAAGDDDLAEPPARLDQPFVGLVDRGSA